MCQVVLCFDTEPSSEIRREVRAELFMIRRVRKWNREKLASVRRAGDDAVHWAEMHFETGKAVDLLHGLI